MAIKKELIKYALLPQFLPRLSALFTNMFAHTAFLIAVIYGSLRLLPPTHPYLNPQNFGRFGLRHVVSEAANNLVLSKKNIDQIVVFFSVLTGLVLLLIQFVLLIMAVTTQPAFAAAASDAFLTFADVLNVGSQYAPQSGHPDQDLAFIILDKVFGVKGIFDSCISTGVTCLGLDGRPINIDINGNALPSDPFPMPFHVALHSMLRFYSLGIFVVSVFIILYFIIAITAETASTGTPFGQRFNKTWVPVRVILFAALLVPLNIGGQNAGINSAQLIVLWTAKTGSNFATNAWGYFNRTLTESYIAGIGGGAEGVGTPGGDSKNLIATPNIPEIRSLAQFLYTARACKIAEESMYNHLHWDSYDEGNTRRYRLDGIQAYLVRNNAPEGELDHILYSATDFRQAAAFSRYDTMNIVFGTHIDENSGQSKARLDQAKKYPGNVIPYCGSLRFKIMKVDAEGEPESGANGIQALYYSAVEEIWTDQDLINRACGQVDRMLPVILDPPCDIAVPPPDKAFTVAILTRFEERIRSELQALIAQQVGQDWDINGRLESKGWVGAALWYNRIAELNGDIANVVQNTPQPKDYPHVMEAVKDMRTATNDFSDMLAVFDPVLPDDQKVRFRREGDEQIASAMYAAFKVWGDDDRITGNIFVDFVNAIFGTSAIFEMRRNTDIHPLAQLSALGKSMMEASVRNIALGLPGEMLLQSANTFPGQLGKAAASFLKTIGTATLAMSFVMYYVLPFLPFIYFIFAVSGWIKSIFEAIVAMPLWALAHIKIDGEGIGGPAAVNGYFLIFEIFLRPILILFGLLSSIAIFSALVTVLNDGLFELIVQNTTGFDHGAVTEGIEGVSIDSARGPIDQFFFTAMYVIIVYMIGIGCFKLIDHIPNTILRWAGNATKTFQEGAGDPAGQVTQKTYSGAVLATGQVQGGALAALG